MSKLNYFRIFSPSNICIVSVAHYDSELKENLNYGIFTGWRLHNLISLGWKFNTILEINERPRYVIKIQNHSNDSENTYLLEQEGLLYIKCKQRYNDL